jgi:hypothetical protein
VGKIFTTTYKPIFQILPAIRQYVDGASRDMITTVNISEVVNLYAVLYA